VSGDAQLSGFLHSHCDHGQRSLPKMARKQGKKRGKKREKAVRPELFHSAKEGGEGVTRIHEGSVASSGTPHTCTGPHRKRIKKKRVQKRLDSLS